MMAPLSHSSYSVLNPHDLVSGGVYLLFEGLFLVLGVCLQKYENTKKYALVNALMCF